MPSKYFSITGLHHQYAPGEEKDARTSQSGTNIIPSGYEINKNHLFDL